MIYLWKVFLLCSSIFVWFNYSMMFQYGNEARISIEAMSRTSMQSKSDYV